jgi:hypothetical protein
MAPTKAPYLPRLVKKNQAGSCMNYIQHLDLLFQTDDVGYDDLDHLSDTWTFGE